MNHPQISVGFILGARKLDCVAASLANKFASRQRSNLLPLLLRRGFLRMGEDAISQNVYNRFGGVYIPSIKYRKCETMMALIPVAYIGKLVAEKSN